jgi:hypothetical protein
MPFAPLSSPRAVMASSVPARSIATELPNSSNASVLDPLMYASCRQVVPVRVKR